MKIYSASTDSIMLTDTTGNLVVFNLSNKDQDSIPGVQARVTVDPSTNSQTVTPDSSNVGFASIRVNPVTSAIDPDIAPQNISSGIEILGVTGTALTIPDFSALGYNETEATHAFISWCERRGAQYDSIQSLLEACRNDIQSSVEWWSEQGYTKDYTSDLSVVTFSRCTVPFVIKTASGMLGGNNRAADASVYEDFQFDCGDAIYCPMYELVLNGLTADNVAKGMSAVMSSGFSNASYEGFTWYGRNNQAQVIDDSSTLTLEPSLKGNTGTVLYNDFNEIAWNSFSNMGSNNIRLFNNIELRFKKHSFNAPKLTNVNFFFENTRFTQGMDGSISLPSAKQTSNVFQGAVWSGDSSISSISCPVSTLADYFFYNGDVLGTLYIGQVDWPSATSTAQAFRFLENTTVAGPIDVHSSTDVENMLAYQGPVQAAPMVTFGPVNKGCLIFYMCESTFSSVPSWDTSLCTFVQPLFTNAFGGGNITSISKMDLSSISSNDTSDDLGSFANGWQNLTTVGGFTGYKYSINMAGCPNLTAESVSSIITEAFDCSALADQPTLTLHAEAYARVTEDTKTLASSKGWTIASA